MNIQNNSNVNFQARRILNVRKTVENGADEVLDVFALGKEDKKFAMRCYNTLKKTNRDSIKYNFANINHLDGDANRGYKNFFRDFANRLTRKVSINTPKFDDVRCYVAIKNYETISGVAEVSDAKFPNASLDRMIFTNKDKSLDNGFLYGILNDLKNVFREEGQNGLNCMKQNTSRYINDNGFLELKNFGKVQRSIALKNQDIEINRVKDNYQYDLEEFLGIKDFESEIMI